MVGLLKLSGSIRRRPCLSEWSGSTTIYCQRLIPTLASHFSPTKMTQAIDSPQCSTYTLPSYDEGDLLARRIEETYARLQEVNAEAAVLKNSLQSLLIEQISQASEQLENVRRCCASIMQRQAEIRRCLDERTVEAEVSEPCFRHCMSRAGDSFSLTHFSSHPLTLPVIKNPYHSLNQWPHCQCRGIRSRHHQCPYPFIQCFTVVREVPLVSRSAPYP